MGARVRGTLNEMRPLLPDGITRNPLFDQLTFLHLRGYPFDKRERRGFSISRIDDYKEFKIDNVLAFVAGGAKVRDYPVWIRLSENKYLTEDVPNYMPKWSVDDLEVTAKKWQDWCMDGQSPSITQDEAGDDIYWMQTSGATGEYVDGDTIKLLDDAGYNLKRQDQMQTIISDNETPE